MTQDLAHAYCLARERGLSASEAAEEAGYSGCASPRARRLYGCYKEVDGPMISTRPAMEKRVDKLRRQFLALRDEMRDAQLWLEAIKLKERT